MTYPENGSRNPRLDVYKATGSSDLLGLAIRARIGRVPLPFSFHQSSMAKQKRIVSITSHPDESRNARCFYGPRMRITLVIFLLLGVTSCDFRDTSTVGSGKSDSARSSAENSLTPTSDLPIKTSAEVGDFEKGTLG